jgi:hypothetical protein
MNPLASIKSIVYNMLHIPTIDITKLEQSTAESEANFEKARTEFHAMMDFVELAMTMIHDSGVYLWYKDLSGRYKFASRAMVSRVLLPQTAAVCDNADVARLVLGKTDQELAAEYQDSHHGRSTFLKTLSIADEHTLHAKKPLSFFETGLVEGTPVWMQSERTLVYDRDGNLNGIKGWGYDSTGPYGDPIVDVQGWVSSGKAVELHPSVFLV